MDSSNATRTVRAGSTTYFLDILQTKDGKPYLAITESRYQQQENEHRRARITVFPEYASGFLATLEEVMTQLNRIDPEQ
jgi:hypothetical protein